MLEKTSNFKLKLGSIAFCPSIFRITPRTSSVFSLSLSSLNFDWEMCSLHQRTTCLYYFMVNVNDYQTDESFFYLKLSNKWIMFLVCGFNTSFQTRSGFNTVYSKETNGQYEIWMISRRQISIQFFIPSLYIFGERQIQMQA